MYVLDVARVATTGSSYSCPAVGTSRVTGKSPHFDCSANSRTRNHDSSWSLVSVVAFALVVGSARGKDPVVVHYSVPQQAGQYCGIDSLYVCLALVGKHVSLAELQEQLPLGPRGVTVEQILKACTENKLSAAAVRVYPSRVPTWTNPTLLHVNDDHFIAFLGSSDNQVTIFDIHLGLFHTSHQRFQKMYGWRGAAIVIGALPPELVFSLYWPYLLAGLGVVGM